MRMIVMLVWLATLGGCLAGCTFTTRNDSEFGFRQSTSWGFYHETKTTAPEATSRTEFPSLESWIKKDDPVEGPPDPANENPAGAVLSNWKQLKPEERAALLPMLTP